jgi:TonB-dependent starch-binding outer membrane protein SusC
MSRVPAGFACLLVVVALAPIADTASASAQEPGTLFGTLFDQQTVQPLVGGTVSIEGQSVQVQTGQDGGFVLTDLPPGPVTIRLTAPGYTTAVEQVVVGAGEVIFHQFEVLPMSATLGEVLVMAGQTGGGSNTDVDLPDDVMGTAQTAADLLAHQVPGLSLSRSGGNVGSGSRIVIRGISSITQSSDPAIYLDGVRIGHRSNGNPVFSASVSFDILDDIPASQVSRIRVLRGSSAAAMYGDSANGVILIETHRDGS